MADERKLVELIRQASARDTVFLLQGQVTAVDKESCACTVRFGRLEISDIRLRASLSNVDRQIMLTPKVDSCVIVGSINGDYEHLVVLQVDEVDTVEINGGNLGGMIKIADLTDKLNKLVNEVNALKDKFNAHTHMVTTSAPSGEWTSAPPISQASEVSRFDKSDYEDEKITH